MLLRRKDCDSTPCVVSFFSAVSHLPIVCRALLGHIGECFAEFYTALSSCPRLRTLCVKYDGDPTLALAMSVNNGEPNPLISPLFLEELSALLSRDMGTDVATPPFPRIEMLSFDLFATVESLALCTDTWRGPLAALTSTTSTAGTCTAPGTDGRPPRSYPQFRRVRVMFEEIMEYAGFRCAEGWDAEVRAAKGREKLRIVEEVEVSVRQSDAVIAETGAPDNGAQGGWRRQSSWSWNWR
ncbi:hypothetical protein C8Q80DRAFT_436359 [Daedaleopsis nitida]|nr:hypothetical protein C8Q80DRAFT_436359 [Daedaleopsis nitida]